MEDFVKSRGPEFLAHLLRRISDQIVQGEELWYGELGGLAPPRTVSTLYALEHVGDLSVTELAALLRQSHPMAITWARQLISRGLVQGRIDARDRRRRILSLTEAGKEELTRIHEAGRVVVAAQDQLFREAEADVYEALWRIEKLLRKTPFVDRLRHASGQTPHINQVASGASEDGTNEQDRLPPVI